MEKAKAKGKRRTPSLLSLCSTVLLRCLLLVKKSRRLRCFELGVRGCVCRWLIRLGSWGSQGGPALRASMFIIWNLARGLSLYSITPTQGNFHWLLCTVLCPRVGSYFCRTPCICVYSVSLTPVSSSSIQVNPTSKVANRKMRTGALVLTHACFFCLYHD
jgi:hypothetical protein